jgi:hypothetical protein
MPDRSHTDEIKRKLRRLKQAELKIRCPAGVGDAADQSPGRKLVWDEFFDLAGDGKRPARYTLAGLADLDREAFKAIIADYFWHIYYRCYQENGILPAGAHDPAILAQLGLPADADSQAIKKRFRELALRYHPDTGGDNDRFIELVDQVKRLQQDR